MSEMNINSDHSTARADEAPTVQPLTVTIYEATLKTRRKIDATIPRERQGWWADVCPGKRLTLRDATASDIARCCLREGASRDPADYFCELPADGALVSREAIDYMHTVAVPVYVQRAVEAHEAAKGRMNNEPQQGIGESRREPLAEDEIGALYLKWDATAGASFADLIRMVERHHGITKEPHK